MIEGLLGLPAGEAGHGGGALIALQRTAGALRWLGPAGGWLQPASAAAALPGDASCRCLLESPAALPLSDPESPPASSKGLVGELGQA